MNENPEQLDTLVLAGGGYKGLSYVGVIRALDELGWLTRFRRLIGCSIGGVILFLLAIGYTHHELVDFVYHFDYADVNDFKIWRMPVEYGFDSGNRITQMLRLMMKRKLDRVDLTFRELMDITGFHLTVNAVCLNTHSVTYFNPDLTPEMSVPLAVRMSMSLPILFTPVAFQEQWYVDGGLLQNFPVTRGEPGHTLGFYFTNDVGITSIDGLESYLLGLWACIYRNANRLNIPEEGYRVIPLNIPGVSTIDVGLNRRSRRRLYLDGYHMTLQGLDSKESQQTPTIQSPMTNPQSSMTNPQSNDSDEDK